MVHCGLCGCVFLGFRYVFFRCLCYCSLCLIFVPVGVVLVICLFCLYIFLLNLLNNVW